MILSRMRGISEDHLTTYLTMNGVKLKMSFTDIVADIELLHICGSSSTRILAKELSFELHPFKDMTPVTDQEMQFES